MHYTLLSRFQGAIFGSLLGEASVCTSPNLTLTEQSLSVWSQIGRRIAERLITCGRVGKIDWVDLPQMAKSSGLAVAALPLALFFHDNLNQLPSQLQALSAPGENESQVVQDALIWGYAIALALREKLEVSRLIPQVLERYEKAPTSLIPQLEQVQALLEQGTPLELAAAQLSRQGNPSQTAIALAFYCFAYTPEDFRLCLLRASRSGYQTSLTTALTGALAGAYNSFSGIPLPWRSLVRQQPMGQDLTQQVSRLFGAWSGVDDPNGLERLLVAAIASFGVIQPRPSLKIISQQDFI